MGRRRRRKKPVDPRMEELLSTNFEELAALTYKNEVGEIPVETIAAAPDRQTVWQVLNWLLETDSDLDPEIIATFEHMLTGYKTKVRMISHAITRERVQRIVESSELEREVIRDLRENSIYMSHDQKVKMLGALGSSIAAGLDNLDRMAGISDTPEEMLGALATKEATGAGVLKDLRPEERENVRRFLTKLKKGIPAVEQLPDEDDHEPV